MNKRLVDLLGLAFWIAVTFGVAAIASSFEPGAWYTTITKPTWTPPGWLFGPVWGILYLAMSISAWLIWRQRSRRNVAPALGIYMAQLFANGLWSWLFFGRRLIGMALIDLIILTLIIALMVAVFVRIHKTAGLLVIPYFLWASFATALNFSIWRLN